MNEGKIIALITEKGIEKELILSADEAYKKGFSAGYMAGVN